MRNRFKQVILSNPVMMRQGPELIKTGSCVISRTNSRERRRRQTGLQIKLYYHVKAASSNTWVLSHYSVPIRAQQLCGVTVFGALGIQQHNQTTLFLVVGLINLTHPSPSGAPGSVRAGEAAINMKGDWCPWRTGSANRTMCLCIANGIFDHSLTRKNPSPLLFAHQRATQSPTSPIAASTESDGSAPFPVDHHAKCPIVY